MMRSCVFSIVVFPTFLAVAVPAGAAGDWLPLGSAGAVRLSLRLITEAPRQPAGRRLVEVRRDFPPGDDRCYALDRVELDCRSGTYRYTGIVLYDRDGEVVNRYRPADQFVPIPAGSYLSRCHTLACPSVTIPQPLPD
ncbi:hypothetical protein GURASL_17980 [Geotalea uraniireducens]|uniref:Surface-adhesin protein E-like domain-containing protein n=1 Tax=Geotalea uraniireducens TaxID=351604 RepID=A0ABN6VUN3_9BACT|nr:hypothetical protein GURASL_17980 [Geotalea uraniireducens]